MIHLQAKRTFAAEGVKLQRCQRCGLGFPGIGRHQQYQPFIECLLAGQQRMFNRAVGDRQVKIAVDQHAFQHQRVAAQHVDLQMRL